ncbi:small T antigen [Alphapolyomavirus quartipanos]|uniref:Small T antigen n=1 Tax=Alphapolyomavirus quartipanos TaxID=1891736 RepID=K7QK01_9POLY|nr:small T antigen [Alphapolyomavirus quartipanos]AFU25582.1 small T antigen [Alphapolyomavirus quartipanos]
MDQILSRSQRKELISLLDLPPDEYGNYPLMKHQFKKMCLVYHPDKGGDGEKMRKLNSLWQLFNNQLLEMRDNRFDMQQVRNMSLDDWDDLLTLREAVDGFEEKFIKVFPCCFTRIAAYKCRCIVCMLRQQHLIMKEDKRYVLWGACFCHRCYLDWYGLCGTEQHLIWWKRLIQDTPFISMRLNAHDLYRRRHSLS